MLMTNPRPEAGIIYKYYTSDDYISHTDSRRTIQEKVYGRVKACMTKKKLGIARKYIKAESPSLLDYGCGTGEFIIAAGKSGFNAIGYEPGAGAAGLAEGKGAELISEKRLRDQGPFYDVISMWHVLEHIHNHNEVLNHTHKILKNSGLLVIAVPMATSYDASYYREFWAGWDVPRHVWHFTPDTLTQTCKKHGFHLVARYAMPFDGFYISMVSEQYQRGNALMAFGRGLAIGLWSHLQAMAKKSPSSSALFVFTKGDDQI